MKIIFSQGKYILMNYSIAIYTLVEINSFCIIGFFIIF